MYLFYRSICLFDCFVASFFFFFVFGGLVCSGWQIKKAKGLVLFCLVWFRWPGVLGMIVDSIW